MSLSLTLLVVFIHCVNQNLVTGKWLALHIILLLCLPLVQMSPRYMSTNEYVIILSTTNSELIIFLGYKTSSVGGELHVQLHETKLQIIQLQQELEAIKENKDTQPSACTQSHGIIDEAWLALRKFAVLYDPFPPLDKEFYQQERPENDKYATNYYLCYESDASALLGTLLDLYSVFPEDQASDIILAKELFLNMVCVYV